MALPFDLAIAFIFVFAIVYGGLEVSKVFKNKGVMSVIALVIAFFAITSQITLNFLQEFLPIAVIIFIIVFIIAIIVKPFKSGGKFEIDFTLLAVVGVLILLLLASGFTIPSGNILPGLPTSDLLTAVGVIIVLLILVAAYKSGKS